MRNVQWIVTVILSAVVGGATAVWMTQPGVSAAGTPKLSAADYQ